MGLWNQLRQHGYLRTAPKQGDKEKGKDVETQNRRKELCLNCTAPKCRGKCRAYEKQRILMEEVEK